MARFDFHAVAGIINAPHSHRGIAVIVNDILLLEERLNEPEKQSWYFQMAFDSHTHHLAGLRVKYERIRGEFNQYSVFQMREEISAQEQRIQAHAHLRPLFARAIVLAGCQRVITDMRDMIAVKKIVDQLPTIDELKQMPQLLEALL